MTLLGLVVLTIIEYFTLALLICKADSQKLSAYITPILIYAPIYVLILLTRAYIPDYISIIAIYVSLVVFIKTVFNKKLITAMLVCLITMFLSLTVIQTLSVAVVGLFLSRPVEFTFHDGLMVLGIALASSILCYLFLPLSRLVYRSKEKKSLLYMALIFFIAHLFLYLLSTTSYFEQLYDRRTIMYIFMYAGISFILTAIYYWIIKNFKELIEKRVALYRFKEFVNLPTSRKIAADNYEGHLQVIHWLSIISDADTDTDRARVMWYVETHLNNFEDDPDNEVGYDSKSKLWKLDNKVLSAYLYVKTKRLRELGVTCEIAINNYDITSKIKTSKLIEAIDILVGEALETSTKERSDLTIALREDRDRDGRSCVDVINRNDLIPGQDTIRMVFEEYSLKTKQVRGLRKLNKISLEYDCRLSLRDEKSFEDENYLRLRYLL